MRIGSILHQFEHHNFRVDPPIQDSTTNRYFHGERCQIRDRRRLNVVMHSSPYLRCTQTAIAVSSGIVKAYDESRCTNQPETLCRSQQGVVEDSKRQEANASSSSSAAQSLMESSEVYRKGLSPERLSSKDKTRRIKLRLDTFLGEWLTADYFEHMYASPNAKHLLESAKADLLRGPESMGDDSDNTIDSVDTQETFTNYLLGDNSKRVIATNNISEEDFQPQGHAGGENFMRTTFKKCDMNLSTIFSAECGLDNVMERASPNRDRLSRFNSIPRGVIDQARAASIEFDSQWDSTKEPLLCGNGGVLGEDWSSMHHRLTTGLHRLLSWYTNEGLHNLEPSEATYAPSIEEYESDEILIIVTHGAACNALIGAFKNQPVVVDVGTSSFTMFVRKDDVDGNPLKYHVTSLTSPCNLSDIYNLELLAETQHLQPGIDPTKIPYNPLIHSTAHSSTLYRLEDERQAGLMRTWAQSINYTSIGVHENIYNGSFQTSERVNLASNFMNWNSPKSDLSPDGHITGFGIWSDLILSPNKGNLEDASDSSSEDNFLLNFANVQHSCKT